jgi:TRAP-type C4-dicarboxylate transport system substrate-binding protein
MTIRKRTLLKGALAAVVLSMTAGAANAAPEFTLRWGHYLSNSPFLQLEKDFAKKVEADTNGRVKIDMTFAGGLGKGGELLALVGRGAIDMAAIVPGYYAKQLPFYKAFQIPFVFSNPKQAIAISIRSFKELPSFKQELDTQNVHFLFHQPLGVYYLTGKDPSCDTIAGLNGKKIRSFGGDVPKIHGAVGAVPVSVGVTQVYEALQRGSLDYSFLNAGKYSCGPVMVIAGHLLVVGNKTWNKLPKDIQDVFTAAANEIQAKYVAFVDGHENAAKEKIVAAGGVFKPFKEMDKWRAMAPDLLSGWVEGMKKRGKGAEAEQVAKSWRAWMAN